MIRRNDVFGRFGGTKRSGALLRVVPTQFLQVFLTALYVEKNGFLKLFGYNLNVRACNIPSQLHSWGFTVDMGLTPPALSDITKSPVLQEYLQLQIEMVSKHRLSLTISPYCRWNPRAYHRRLQPINE